MNLPDCLKSVSQKRDKIHIDTPGQWLILCDLHMPYHDEQCLKAAIDEAKRLKVSGIILNGDTLDCMEISQHEKDRDLTRYVSDVKMGSELLKWLRKLFPKARIVYKKGNHDDRYDRYLIKHAPALVGLPGHDFETALQVDDFGVECVADKKIIMLGKLNVIHGHEYRGGGGVNPARWLYLQAGDCTIMGHLHRTSEHHERDIADYNVATWSVGCACDLKPLWCPLNKWNHGFATVNLAKDGSFTVSNRRVLPSGVIC